MVIFFYTVEGYYYVCKRLKFPSHWYFSRQYTQVRRFWTLFLHNIISYVFINTLCNFSTSSLIRAESCRFASKLFSFSAGTQRPLVPPDNRKTSNHFFIPAKPGFATFCLFSSCKKKNRIWYFVTKIVLTYCEKKLF